MRLKEFPSKHKYEPHVDYALRMVRMYEKKGQIDYSTESGRRLAYAIVNKAFLLYDESEKWPICNKFNVTRRAIRKTRDFKNALGGMDVDEYAHSLDQFISEITNTTI